MNNHILVATASPHPSPPSPVKSAEGVSSEERAAAAEVDLDTRGDWDNVGNEGNFPRERGKRRKRSLSAQIIIQPGAVIYGRQAGSSGQLHRPSRPSPLHPGDPLVGEGREAGHTQTVPMSCPLCCLLARPNISALCPALAHFHPGMCGCNASPCPVSQPAGAIQLRLKSSPLPGTRKAPDNLSCPLHAPSPSSSGYGAASPPPGSPPYSSPNPCPAGLQPLSCGNEFTQVSGPGD